jgi:hypothetical protein
VVDPASSHMLRSRLSSHACIRANLSKRLICKWLLKTEAIRTAAWWVHHPV